MSLKEILFLAYTAITVNKLRSVLTILIIGFGIMALIGITTAIDVLKKSIANNFSSMGANSFTFINKNISGQMSKKGKKVDYLPNITWQEAQTFKTNFTTANTITALSTRATDLVTVKHGSKKSNPNIILLGVDENYFTALHYNIAYGRFFSNNEMLTGQAVAVLGNDLAKQLFTKKNNALNKNVSINGRSYAVIGVLESPGQSQFGNSGKSVYIPLQHSKNSYGITRSMIITVSTTQSQLFTTAITEAEGLFRVIRKCNLEKENNFATQRSDDILHQLDNNLVYVTAAAVLIGLITLLGAAIGLMNIMLVSVNERTREIGISKAIGATDNSIKKQFLLEAILICQIGGIVGIVLGILAGNITALLMNGVFSVPWNWVVIGIITCFVVGILAGIYPAIRASKLQPIQALRWE